MGNVGSWRILSCKPHICSSISSLFYVLRRSAVVIIRPETIHSSQEEFIHTSSSRSSFRYHVTSTLPTCLLSIKLGRGRRAVELHICALLGGGWGAQKYMGGAADTPDCTLVVLSRRGEG